MHHSTNTILLPFPQTEPVSTLNAFIVYEDVHAGKRAKEMCDLLAENLGRHWRVDSELWNFRALQVPRLREIAAENAGIADMAIVSCFGADLPEAVTEWLDSWTMRPNRAVALIGLFPEEELDPDSIPSARATLVRAARRGGMRFFSPLDLAFPSDSSGAWPSGLFSAEEPSHS